MKNHILNAAKWQPFIHKTVFGNAYSVNVHLLKPITQLQYRRF